MKKLLYLFMSLLVVSNFTFANSKTTSTSITIEDIDETKYNEKTNNIVQNETIQKPDNQYTQVHIPFTGWFQIQGQWIYLLRDIPVTGWQYITGNGWDGWYYFDINSAILLQNSKTPDGYFVDSNGKWVIDYKEPTLNISNSSTNENNKVKDENSKYLYNRVVYNGAKSLTSSITLGNETLKKNNIRFSKNNTITIPDSGKYTILKFNYMVLEPDIKNEYCLEIYVNDELESEIDNFTNTKQEYSIEFEEHSSIKLKWIVNNEEGSKTNKANQLYVYNGVLNK